MGSQVRIYDPPVAGRRTSGVPATGVYRTPEECFEGLPEFRFEPSYRTVGELRLAHLDVGEGPPVVMVHGEPTWSFLWRKVIPPVRDAGFRCVVPDLAGFGRSDKPTDLAWHSLERHVELTGSLFEDLDLRDATLVVHDWSGPIGLTVALAKPDRIARLVILDTFIDFREAWISEAWVRFREFVERSEDLPVGALMRTACFHEPAEAVLAGYDAPFPKPESKVGARSLPMLMPRMDDEAAAAQVERFYDTLHGDTRPVLILWAEFDLIFSLSSAERLASRIGHKIDHVIPRARYALQEDQGPLIGKLIAEWLLDRGS